MAVTGWRPRKKSDSEQRCFLGLTRASGYPDDQEGVWPAFGGRLQTEPVLLSTGSRLVGTILMLLTLAEIVRMLKALVICVKLQELGEPQGLDEQAAPL